MKNIAEHFVDQFYGVSQSIFTPHVVRKVYDNCTALTSTMIDKPDSVLRQTLFTMADYLKIQCNIDVEVERIDIALFDKSRNFVIPVEVENNSGSGKRDDTIFSTEIPKLIRYHGKLMVFITYDYNEEDRMQNAGKRNWRSQFTKRLENELNTSNVLAPFLFIVGNTPKYAGNLNSYGDNDCVINWSFWIKEHGNNGVWKDV